MQRLEDLHWEGYMVSKEYIYLFQPYTYIVEQTNVEWFIQRSNSMYLEHSETLNIKLKFKYYIAS